MDPTYRELDTIYIGQPWRVVITAYADEARTQLFDFTGWTAAVTTTRPVLDITTVLDVDTATITVSMARADTALLRPGCAAYGLSLTAPDDFDSGLFLQGPLPILNIPTGVSP